MLLKACAILLAMSLLSLQAVSKPKPKKPTKPPVTKQVKTKDTTPKASTEDTKNPVKSVTPTPEPAKVVEKPIEKKPDVVFENFNSGLGKWKIDGTAFAEPVCSNPDLDPKAPYRGEVVGIEGKGYINTLTVKDLLKATGTAVSEDFVIDHSYMHLKVGGYKDLVGSGVRLIVDGKTVRAATGFGEKEKEYKGSHKLKPVTWDVREFQGKTVHIEVYDESEESFVMVDSIYQSDDDQKTTRYLDIPNLVAIDPERQKWLQEAIELQKKYGRSPAVGACIVSHGKVVALAVTGERKYGSGVLVTENDAFQMGSISKPITATLTAVMIEEGVLDWNTRIVDVFPQLVPEGNPYRNVTVLQLLSHSGGFPPNSKDFYGMSFREQKKDLKEKYRIFVQEYVQTDPIGPVGITYGYSSGPLVVVAMLAARTGLTYNQMLQKYIVGPLGLCNTYARVAVTAEQDPDVKFMWQHNCKDGKVVAVAPIGWPWPHDVGQPLGAVDMKIEDQGRFIIAHMQNGGGPRLLRNDSLDVLHTPVIQVGAGEDACPGFGASRDKMWDAIKPVIHHSGSNGANYSEMAIAPGALCGFSMCMNSVPDETTEEAKTARLETKLFLAINDFAR